MFLQERDAQLNRIPDMVSLSPVFVPECLLFLDEKHRVTHYILYFLHNMHPEDGMSPL